MKKSTEGAEQTPPNIPAPDLIDERAVHVFIRVAPENYASLRRRPLFRVCDMKREPFDRETREWIHEQCVREWALFEIGMRQHVADWTGHGDGRSRQSSPVPRRVRAAAARWFRAFDAYRRERIEAGVVADAVVERRLRGKRGDLDPVAWPEATAFSSNMRRRATWFDKAVDDLSDPERRMLFEHVAPHCEAWRYAPENPDSVSHAGLTRPAALRIRAMQTQRGHVAWTWDAAARAVVHEVSFVDVADLEGRRGKHRGPTAGPFWQPSDRRTQEHDGGRWEGIEMTEFVMGTDVAEERQAEKQIAREIHWTPVQIRRANRADNDTERARCDALLDLFLAERCGRVPMRQAA